MEGYFVAYSLSAWEETANLVGQVTIISSLKSKAGGTGVADEVIK